MKNKGSGQRGNRGLVPTSALSKAKVDRIASSVGVAIPSEDQEWNDKVIRK